MIKLNLGCGNYHKIDYINIDIDEKVKPDLQMDLTKEQLPFKDNSVYHIFSNHFFEHITKEETSFLLKELNRVLMNNGFIKICVPHYLNPVAYQYEHKQIFSEQYFIENNFFDFTYRLSYRRYKFIVIPCNIYFTLEKKNIIKTV